MQLIQDSILKEKSGHIEDIICSWCGDPISVQSYEQQILVKDIGANCCLGCFREGQILAEEMFRNLENSTR